MLRLGRSAIALSLLLSAACGSSSPGSPASPSSGSSSSQGKFQTTGRLTDAISGAGISGVTATSTDSRTLYVTATDSTGAFSLGVDTASTGGMPFTFAGASIVTRQTYVQVPGNAIPVTAIPKTFDLTSFDEMCRLTKFSDGSTKLTRWTSAPPLTIQSQVMQYTDVNNSAFPAIAQTMTAGEVSSLSADMTWALPQMTGSTFQAFQTVATATASADSSVTMLNTGQITVGRFAGLTAATGALGLSRWLFQTDGKVIRGMIMLDRDHDASGVAKVRIVRAHELGHALGYSHVVSRESIMNAQPVIEPNAGDLAATKLAFLRPPGNKSPDTDPSGTSLNLTGVRAIWSDPIR